VAVPDSQSPNPDIPVADRVVVFLEKKWFYGSVCFVFGLADEDAWPLEYYVVLN